MKTQLNNKNVLITGGTSGLGKALAEHLLASGARVAIVARTQADLQTMQVQYPELITIAADVGRKDDIYRIVAEAESRLGEVDALFNVASSLGATPLRSLVDTDCEDLEAVLQTNLIGPFRLTKALLGSMLLRQGGTVVNISSDAAVSAYPTWGAYSVSKAALDHLTRIFDVELREQGIRFLAIDPGDMNTPMHFAAIPDAKAADLRDPTDSAAQLLAILNQSHQEVRSSL